LPLLKFQPSYLVQLELTTLFEGPQQKCLFS